MEDIREEEERLRKKLSEYYAREDELTEEEYYEMRWIEGFLQDIELKEMSERR